MAAQTPSIAVATHGRHRHRHQRGGRLGKGGRRIAERLAILWAGARAALGRLPLGTLLSLVAAVAVFGGFVRLVLPTASSTTPADGTTRVASAPVAQPEPAPASAPASSLTSPRTFDSLADAGRWLGVPVWHLTALPAGMRLVEVQWLGDPPSAAVPGSLPRGQLLAHFAAADGGEALTLVQGRWRIDATGAPGDHRGTSILPNGTEVIWTRGMRLEDVTHPDLSWAGDEIRVGSTAPTDWGWWLASSILPLDQMLGVAASVVQWDAGVAAAGGELTYYLVRSEEEAALLRALLTSGQEWMATLLTTERVEVVTSDADEAAVRAALAELDRIRQSEGLPGVRVVDSRPR
jgi:hypothetical protein